MRLGDVIKINPESVHHGYPYSEIEYIDISSVGTGTLLQTQRLQTNNAPSRARRVVREGDTLLATVRPNLRSFWLVRNPKKNTIASTGFAVLRAGKDIDKRFLYFLVTNQSFTDYLTANAKGAAYPAVDTEIIARAEIFLPPLPIQKKIAAILSAYDDLIENNTRRIKILEEMAQRIYREWFVHFRYPGHENQKLVESELGMIPEGWEISLIKSIIEFHIGGGWGNSEKDEKHVIPGWVTRGTDIPHLKVGNNVSCQLRYHKEDNIRKRTLKPGDIVFEVSGGSKDQPLGRCLLINQTLLNSFQLPVICASFCKLIRPTGYEKYSNYLYWSLVELYDSRQIMEYQVQSTGLSNFKFSEFIENRKLLLPPKTLLSHFNDNVSELHQLIQLLGQMNNNLLKTRDSLLPKLISGQIDVSDLDIDTEEVA